MISASRSLLENRDPGSPSAASCLYLISIATFPSEKLCCNDTWSKLTLFWILDSVDASACADRLCTIVPVFRSDSTDWFASGDGIESRFSRELCFDPRAEFCWLLHSVVAVTTRSLASFKKPSIDVSLMTRRIVGTTDCGDRRSDEEVESGVFGLPDCGDCRRCKAPRTESALFRRLRRCCRLTPSPVRPSDRS
jgi:hypothetical protein